LAACVAAVRYAGGAEHWIHRFKYPRGGLRGLDPAPYSVISALLREAAQRVPGVRPDLVVPVPQHPKRLRARGFNPAGLLARALARELRVPFDPVALRRIRNTPSQTGLDRQQRRRNVRGAFRVRRNRRLPERIWLVDDVVTTGSTMAETASALRRSDVTAVIGVCAARTLSDASASKTQSEGLEVQNGSY
jgi:ComF family protein